MQLIWRVVGGLYDYQQSKNNLVIRLKETASRESICNHLHNLFFERRSMLANLFLGLLFH